MPQSSNSFSSYEAKSLFKVRQRIGELNEIILDFSKTTAFIVIEGSSTEEKTPHHRVCK